MATVDSWDTPAKIAIARARKFYPTASNFLLEEIEKTSKGHWLVTVGFDVPGSANQLSGIKLSSRLYKLFEITPAGDVLRMKIRHVPE